MFGSKLEIKRFEEDILFYESQPVQKGKILLYGDSLFTRCSCLCCDMFEDPDIEKELLMKDGSQAVLNHGFGTSSADDLLYYYSRMVRPYEPRALVLSTGSNDHDYGYSPMEIMEIQGRIVDYAQADFPGMPIYICAHRPVPRSQGKKSCGTRCSAAYNRLLEIYCAEKPGVACLRLQDMPFLYQNPEETGEGALLREDVCCSDRAHFNALGYRYFFEYLREQFDALL